MAGFWGQRGLGLVLLATVGACQKSTDTVPARGVATAAPTASEAPEPEATTPPDPPAAPTPEPKLEDEIAWAKLAYPKELGDVKFESLASKLLAWVPVGSELAVYVSSDEKACVKTILSHEDGADALRGKFLTQESAKERSWNAASFGHYFETEAATGTDGFENGKWVDRSVSAIGDPPDYYGTLSSIDDEVAVFGGIPVRIDVECDGPDETWTCPSGGSRSCDSCKQSRVEVVESAPNVHYARMTMKQPSTCKDDCPVRVPPDRARLEALFARSTAFTVEKAAKPPRLYRSKQRCLSERKRRNKKP